MGTIVLGGFSSESEKGKQLPNAADSIISATFASHLPTKRSRPPIFGRSRERVPILIFFLFSGVTELTSIPSLEAITTMTPEDVAADGAAVEPEEAGVGSRDINMAAAVSGPIIGIVLALAAAISFLATWY